MKTFLIVLLSFYSLFAHGGRIVDNGGTVIFCDNVPGQPRFQTLDTYEFTQVNDLKYIDGLQKLTAPEMLTRVMRRFLDQPIRDRDLVLEVYYNFFFDLGVEEGVELTYIDDAYPFMLPKDCRLVQAMIHVRNPSPLQKKYYVNGEIWRQLDDLNRAMLVTHEVVYTIAAASGDQADSRNVRYMNGLLWSQQLDWMAKTAPSFEVIWDSEVHVQLPLGR
jgi:hypothetical protein